MKENLDLKKEKIRFFGLYLEQRVAKEIKYPNSPAINVTTVLEIEKIDEYFLELKKLKLINQKDNQNINDYLRVKGFAVPFKGYSVNHLVKIGWVKLID
jgi:hypothetical protein